ncbi:hypothetical protein [Jannaschia rubra]|uniref:hypothetical protein n=1 Tax=Jannaschia rubra TaxID=282197 RepID=UPI0024906C80|nr:hypothetical protein [Jannaschia rubra]
MPRPQRLTRRFPAQMSEAAFRRLRKFATDAGLDESEALSFLFENFESVTHEDNLNHRLRLYREMLARRETKGG